MCLSSYASPVNIVTPPADGARRALCRLPISTNKPSDGFSYNRSQALALFAGCPYSTYTPLLDRNIRQRCRMYLSFAASARPVDRCCCFPLLCCRRPHPLLTPPGRFFLQGCGRGARCHSKAKAEAEATGSRAEARPTVGCRAGCRVAAARAHGALQWAAAAPPAAAAAGRAARVGIRIQMDRC
jgi:hypothetical protein